MQVTGEDADHRGRSIDREELIEGELALHMGPTSSDAERNLGPF